MPTFRPTLAFLAAALVASACSRGATVVSSPAVQRDARVGLKAGLYNAGEAISNLELMATTGGDVGGTVDLDEFVAAMSDHEPGRADRKSVV